MKPINFRFSKFVSTNLNQDITSLSDDELAFSMNVDITKQKTITQREGLKTRLVHALGAQLYGAGFGVNPRYNTAFILSKFNFGGNVLHRIHTYSYDVVSETFSYTTYADINDSADGIFLNIPFLATHLFFIGNKIYNLSGNSTTLSFGKPALAEVYGVRLFLVTVENPRTLYFSSIGDPFSFPTNNFFLFDSNITSLAVAGSSLFVGTNSGLYKIEQTGDANLPFQMTQIARIPIMYNTLIEIKSGVLGGFSTSGKYFIFDAYALSGTQMIDTVADSISNVIRYLSYPTAATITQSFPVKAKYTNKGLIIYSFPYENKLTQELPFFSDYISSGGRIQLVLNLTTFGWTFYNIKEIIDMKEFYDNVLVSIRYPLVNQNDNNIALLSFSNITWDEMYEGSRNIPIEVVTKGITIPSVTVNFRDLFISSNAKTTGAISVEAATSGVGTFTKVGVVPYNSGFYESKLRLNRKANVLVLKLKKEGHINDFNITSFGVSGAGGRKI